MGMIKGLIGLSIGAIVFANLFMQTVINTDTSQWTTSQATLWSTVGVVGVAGFVYGTANIFGMV